MTYNCITKMQKFIIILVLVTGMAACKKDKFTTAPQISFKSLKPDVTASNNTNSGAAPVLTIKITDSEGDIGFKPGSDTSMIYVKNVLTGKIDSTILPDLQGAGLKNFQAEIDVNLFRVLGCAVSTRPRPRTDTTFIEVYVKDFAKNKSNVLLTPQPVFFRCL